MHSSFTFISHAHMFRITCFAFMFRITCFAFMFRITCFASHVLHSCLASHVSHHMSRIHVSHHMFRITCLAFMSRITCFTSDVSQFPNKNITIIIYIYFQCAYLFLNDSGTFSSNGAAIVSPVIESLIKILSPTISTLF